MSITFDVSKEALASLRKTKLPTTSLSNSILDRIGVGVEACGSNDIFLVKEAFSHPFVEAVHLSFARHYPLTISPDMIWLCIAQGLSNHINLNAEELRGQFVSHQGKQLIMIRRDNFVKGSSNNDWQGCFSEFSDKLSEFIGKKRDLIVSNFSTTGLIEKAVSEVILMDSMKSYFKYGVMTMCGIPSITLLGTADDWKNIRTRIENLAEFGLSWWTDQLLPILDKVIDTSKGNVDVDFWNSFYKEDNESGGPYVNGWINMFFPYVKGYGDNPIIPNKFIKNNSGHGLGLHNFLAGMSKVNFKWQYYTTTYDMEFLGGFVGFSQDQETLALSPTLGWGIRDQGTSKEGPINPNEDW